MERNRLIFRLFVRHYFTIYTYSYLEMLSFLIDEMFVAAGAFCSTLSVAVENDFFV